MTPIDPFHLFLAIVSFIGGFLSGLLSIGGAIILIPFLFYLPPLLKIDALPMYLISGLAAIQSTAGSISALYHHRHSNFFHKVIWIPLGIGAIVGGCLGGASSKYLNDTVMLYIYLVIVAISIYLLISAKNTDYAVTEENYVYPLSHIKGVFIGTVIGLVAGVTGVGGGPPLSSSILYFYKVTMKPAIINALIIVCLLSISASLSKIFTGQVNFQHAFIVVFSASCGAPFGVWAHKFFSDKILKTFLLLILIISFLKVAIDLIPTK